MNKNEIIQIQGMEYKEMTKQLLNKCALATLIPSKVSLIGITVSYTHLTLPTIA